ENEVCSRVDDAPRDLGKADVVAGLHADCEPAQGKGLRLVDDAGHDPVGLALPESVVEVELALLSDKIATLIDGDEGIGEASAALSRVRTLDEARHKVHAELAREPGESRDEWSIDRFCSIHDG